MSVPPDASHVGEVVPSNSDDLGMKPLSCMDVALPGTSYLAGDPLYCVKVVYPSKSLKVSIKYQGISLICMRKIVPSQETEQFLWHEVI